MLEEFRKYISDHDLFTPSDHILLAVSGGMDSVVMTELFHRAGFKFGIAHCNFGLRGKESDGDEVFVEKLAGKYNVPFFTKRFLTTKVTKERGISVQMAARELRYAWFEEIRKKHKYSYIATAHHLDDQAETFFINLLRSTGIAGFHGILPKQGNIIRPLLFCFRDDIDAYCRKKNLAFREDSSNSETKYLRNKIRHEILPIFRELNPSFPQILSGTIQRIKETEIILRKSIESIRKKIIRKDKNGIRILFTELKNLEPAGIFAYELLSPYGFHEDVIRDILESTDNSSGKIFYSPTHRLILNRKELILEPISDKKKSHILNKEISIPENQKEIYQPIRLTFTKKTKDKKFVIDPSAGAANLDLGKIRFPLTLRKWKRGDSFHPLGMDNKKKLSDYFINNKFSIPEKENAWLLCSGSDIIWIAGHRIDHRYRVTTRTKEVLVVRWIVKK